MSFTEFHFNSNSRSRSSRSTRSRPVFELNEYICPRLFQLKTLSLPLLWKNISGGGRIVFYDVDDDKYTFTFKITAFPGTAASLVTALDIAFQNAVPVPAETTGNRVVSIIAHPTAGNTFETALLEDQRIGFFFRSALIENDSLARVEIFYDDALRQLVNRGWELANTPLTMNANTEASTLFPVRVIPPHIYFHSNLMYGTPHGSVIKPIGSEYSRTIFAKIQIDSNLEFINQMQSYVNETLQPEFMFSNISKLNNLEFWFTTEDGTQLDLENLEFSFTISMII